MAPKSDPDWTDAHAHDETRAPQTRARTIERAAAIFRAAGEPARLRILERLLHREYCVSDLADELGDGLSTISQRLRLLREARLIARRRSGKHIYYRLADAHVGEIITSAITHAAEEAR